ncbi:MAG: cupin domain-containing protein [Solirubrobacterales bacterium]|nr:cupin domain-containing protein [Solirubrobacterales bacterium]
MSPAEQPDEVGLRLRSAREAKELSLRELARRLDLSASALSQIETGKSRPSVKTLYAIVSELGLSLDLLFASDEGAPRPGPGGANGEEGANGGAAAVVVQRAGSRSSLELDSGVSWERLTAAHDPAVDFLYATYEVGGASSPNDKLVRHSGREYGVVLSGELEVTVGFETYALGEGDSICFDSQEPHLLANRGDAPATAIWFVIGRRQSDPCQPSFNPNG